VADDRVVRPTSIRIADGGGQSARELVFVAGSGVTFTTELVDGRLELTVDAAGGSAAWADITGTPTTLAGYGITDACSDAELAAHVAAGDPHPAYALEAALGSAAALNASTARVASGILQLGTNLLYGIDHRAADLANQIAYSRSAAGTVDNSGWANPSVSGSGGSQSNARWSRLTNSTSAGWQQTARLADTAEGFVVAVCFKLPTTVGARRLYVGLCSTTVSDSDTPAGHFVGLRYSSTVPDAGFVSASRDGTTTTIGTAFAAPVADVAYLMILTGAAGGSVVVELIRLDTGARETATISATLPAAATKIDVVCYVWNQGVSKALEMSYMYRFLPML
jgi:hypothetical protein